MTDKLREKLINAGRVLVDEGQGDYVWGHISARIPGEPNRFLMKPGCIGVEEMNEDNIITVDIEGEKVSGDWPRHNEVYIHSEVLRARPYEDLGFARVDHHRSIRQGFPEVILGLGKTPAQIAAIA